MKILLALLVLSASAAPFAAQDVDTQSGNFMFESCRIALHSRENREYNEDKIEAWRDGVCEGTINGIAFSSPYLCPAKEVTKGQELRVVVKYLGDHPEKLHLSGLQLIHDALQQAFPCN
jgi:Rap1a immunity proteins